MDGRALSSGRSNRVTSRHNGFENTFNKANHRSGGTYLKQNLRHDLNREHRILPS